MDDKTGMDDGRIAELEAEIKRLRSIAEGGEKRFLRVENLTSDHVTLPHPSLEDKHNRVLGPCEIALVDREFQNSEYVVKARDMGIIAFEEANSIDDDGRAIALGEDFKLQDPRLEQAALQFLLFPGDDLSNRKSEGSVVGNKLNVEVMAQVLWELIHYTPRLGDKVNVDYLQSTHIAFLQNVVQRERIWRNRVSIIKVIENRIREIDQMDRMGRVSGKD